MTMSEPGQDTTPLKEVTNILDDPLDIGRFQNIMDIYESDQFSDSYDSEDGEEDDDDDDDEDDEDEEEEDTEEEKDTEALCNNLSTYESQLDKERFSELEKMLTECDDVIKESDRHLGTLDLFKKTVSLTFSDSDEDDVEDLEFLQICGSAVSKGDNSQRETTNDMENKQLFLTEGPAENDTDKKVHNGEIIPALPDRISNLTKMLQLQLNETDETYEKLLGQQSKRHQEMNDNSAKLDSERRDNLALLEDEKVQRQHEKEERETAMVLWEEDHQIQVKEDLEIHQIQIQKIEEILAKEKEAGEYLTQIHQEYQRKLEMNAAIIIQSTFRMYRVMKEYRIVQEKRKEEKRKEEEEERRKVEEEKENKKRRQKENEERIRREEEEERKKKEEEERRNREEEERRKKMEEEERKVKEEERKKREEEERNKREEEERMMKEEERKKREEEERKKREEEEEKMKKQEEERRKREMEEKKKKEEEERKKREEEKMREEEEKKKREAEERIKSEEEERRKRERERIRKEEEEQKKRKDEEERVKREEEERKNREEEERKRREEEENKKEEEERKKRERQELKQHEEGMRWRSNEEEEKEKEEKQKTMREDEEKKTSGTESLQKREKEVGKRKEEDIKTRKKEEDIESYRDAKMEDLYIETKHKDDMGGLRNLQGEAICDKKAGDKKQRIKEGGIMNKEREGVREKEKEERDKDRVKVKEPRLEKNGERREELKTEMEKGLCRRMDDNGAKNEPLEVAKKDPKNLYWMPVPPALSKDQQEINAVMKTGKVEETYLQPLPHTLNVKRLEWMENCLPWGKVSNQPWIGDKKNQTLTKLERKRPPSKKRLPNPLTEGVILSTTKCTSLTQVTSVHLKDLNGFTLATLGQCPHLQYLSVNNCQLLTLDGLQTCSQMRYIDVKNNNMEYVNVKGMDSLQVLDLSHNNLGLIHGLDGCTNLLWLNMQRNRITKLGSGLDSLRRLHTLLLGHNQLISTSGLQAGGVELQTLDLSHNQLHNVMDIEKFCLLRSLDVSCNNLMETPNLTNQVLMQDLNLSDNSLSSLIELSQCWLPLLRVLNLGQNRLTSVPPLEYVHSMKTIDITNNQLLDSAEIAKALSNCKRLKQLLLCGNPLSDEQDIRKQMIQAFPDLHYLDWNSESSNASVLEENLSTSTSKIQLDNGFQYMCANETEVFEKLEHDFHQRIKSIFELEPLDLLGACNAHVKWCQKSLRIAIECRYAHEYGDTSADKLLLVDESIEQLQGSASTLTNMENSEIVAKVTSPATYRDPSCHTAGKSQDTCPKGQVSEAHLDRSGHNHPVVAASGRATLQEHAATAEAVSAKHSETHEYRRLESRRDIRSDDCNDSQKKKNQNETAKRPNPQDSNQIEGPLLKRNKAATRIQAAWRGFILRVKLQAALEFAQNVYEEESEFGEEIDLESFDMAEADLEKTWTVSDTPSIPMNFPVLGKPPLFRDSSHLNLGLPKSQDGNRSNFDNNPSPAPPREAWNSPVVTARSHLYINGALRSKSSEVLRISPPTTSVSGNRESDLLTVKSRRKDDEICKEWGFKDSRTAQMMLQRAKKMKFNAERREKLKKLDPHQRLALFRKLGEVAPLMPVKSPPMKMLPKKEYFQSRHFDSGLNIGHFETISKEEETKIKENRTFQWLHTQVTPPDNGDARSQPRSANSDTRSQQSFTEKKGSQSSKKTLINTSQRLILFQNGQGAIPGTMSTGTSEPSRSAMGSESGSNRNSRRQSTPGSKRPVHLPPIDNSAPAVQLGGWMSHWNPDVKKSGGWGCGKKRNKRRRSHNVFDAK